jgi:hypothetical protein
VGTFHCQGGAIVCTPDNMPVSEVCDGQDNDCDGASDEGNPGGGGACNTGQLGVCGPGALQCQSGSLACVANQSPSGEVCDGQDNDCDGQTDENNPGGGGACSTGLPGICSPGTVQCQAGALACVQNNPPAAEQCNSVDDDCDGSVDEGNPGGGASCNTGQAGVCAAGTTSCQLGSIACLPNTTPSPEQCNNLDDDCDGQIDEGDPGGGGSCNSGQPGICGPGIYHCQSGLLSCFQNQSPTAEQCNGLDDDCDGAADEGNPGGGMSCATGQPGICAAGTTACSGGSVQCQANNSPQTEQCGDGLDNDCDGQTDEGCCAHSLCTTGGPLTASCDSCVATVCANDPFCCNSGWDGLCVSQVATECNSTQCSSCPHATCSIGGTAQPFTAGCDGGICVTAVCAADPYCCDTDWDQLCVDAINTECPPATCP